MSQDQRFKYSGMLECVDQYIFADVSRDCSTTNVKALWFFKTLVTIYQSRWLEIQLAWDVMPHQLVNS